ncbi:MAG: hypothetical protein RMM53_06155 [Bacteroidia bacterium]|nr:hypothetical protein [Bacteroidia bacterium]MDW8333778.1 hypothetical protein [Bacteroidia bacterium]
MTFRRQILKLVLALAAGGCVRKIDYDPSDRNWFPAVEGRYRIYRVDSTKWVRCEGSCTSFDTLIGSRNNRFVKVRRTLFRKDLTDSVETDLRDRITHRLHILYAPYDSATDSYGPFEFYRVWTQYKDQYQAERIEATIKYVVLRFPPSTRITWNGNEFNALGREDYRYLSIDTTVTVNGQTFEGCAFVLQRKRKTLSEEFYTYEIYAPNVGLIERYNFEMIFFVGADNNGNLFYELQRATIEHLTLKEHNYY